MPAPVVQFAPTADGGRIGFHVLGTGPGIAMLYPYHVNHIALNWGVPLHRAATKFLARHLTVINLDFRGAGLSSPLRGGLTLEDFSDALDVVLAATGQERVALCAMGAAGLIACHFAVRQPERVTRLVFIASGDSPANRHLLHLRQGSPDIEAELRGTLLGGVGDKRNALALARVARASLTSGMLAAWESLLARENLTDFAREIKAPALYLHAADDRLVPLSAAQSLVSQFDDATLRIVPGRSGMDIWRNMAAVDEIIGFLRTGNELPPMARPGRRGSNRFNYPAGLSEREAEVIRLVALGRTNRQIADELFISLNTVSHHLRNIFSKAGASNRTEAAAFAIETGIALLADETPRQP